MSPWPRSRALCILAALWSLPLGLLGLLAAGWFWLCGHSDVLASDGAVEVWSDGPFATWMGEHGWAGFTFGWTIFYWVPSGAVTERTRRRERRHVWQFLLCGPMFPVLYVVALASGYWGNIWEEDARAHEEAPCSM